MSLLGVAAIAGLGLSALSGALGMSQSAKASREQKALIQKQASSNEAWYQRNYYQNYLDSAEARSAMKRVEDTLRRRNQQAEGAAAVTGATREAVLAQQENDQKALADTAEQLAARGDEIKRQVDAQNQANKANINGMQMQQAAIKEQGGQQMLNNGLSLLGSSISMFGQMGSGSGAATKAPADTSSPTATPTADTKVADTNNAAVVNTANPAPPAQTKAAPGGTVTQADTNSAESIEDIRRRLQYV